MAGRRETGCWPQTRGSRTSGRSPGIPILQELQTELYFLSWGLRASFPLIALLTTVPASLWRDFLSAFLFPGRSPP